MEPGHDDLWTALHATMRALSRLERKVVALEAQLLTLQTLTGTTPAEVGLVMADPILRTLGSGPAKRVKENSDGTT